MVKGFGNISYKMLPHELILKNIDRFFGKADTNYTLMFITAAALEVLVSTVGVLGTEHQIVLPREPSSSDAVI